MKAIVNQYIKKELYRRRKARKEMVEGFTQRRKARKEIVEGFTRRVSREGENAKA